MICPYCESTEVHQHMPMRALEWVARALGEGKQNVSQKQWNEVLAMYVLQMISADGAGQLLYELMKKHG